MADVLGRPVQVPAVVESTALGAAMYAGIGAGLYRDLAEVVDRVVRFDRTFEPDPANRAVYDEAYARWSAVYHGVLQLSETGLLRPMWWPAGA